MSYFRDNIEKLTGYVPGFQPDSGDVVKLNTNENPYPPSPKAIQAIKNITLQQLRRYPDPSGSKFRKAAADINDVSPENIICTNGGDDLLTIAFRCFTDKDRPVAYPTPTYSLYPVLAKIQDCPAIEIPFNDDYSLPNKLAKTNAALTIVCNPNAPSSTFITPEILAGLAEKLKGILLIDEAYVDFAPTNCTELVKNFDNVIILRSMSKGYSLAGLRFGYGIASEPLIKDMAEKVKDSYNVDTIATETAAAAITDRDYFQQNVKKIKQQREILTEELIKLGFVVPDSSTNFLLAKYKTDAEPIYNALADKNIFVRYWKTDGLNDKLRITVGTGEQNQKLVEALKEILI